MFAAFITTTQKWQWPFGIYTIETGLCLIALVLLLDETYYNRRISEDRQPKRKNRLLRLIGVEQWQSRSQRSTFREAVMRLVKVIMKPTLVISSFYYMVMFMWVIGINTTLSIFVTKLYGFGTLQIGSYLTSLPIPTSYVGFRSPMKMIVIPNTHPLSILFKRLLLLHTCYRCFSGRDHRPLASRLPCLSLHAASFRAF